MKKPSRFTPSFTNSSFSSFQHFQMTLCDARLQLFHSALKVDGKSADTYHALGSLLHNMGNSASDNRDDEYDDDDGEE